MQVLTLSRVQSVSGASGEVQGLFGNLDRTERSALYFMDEQARNSATNAGASAWNTAWNMYFVQAMQD